MRFAGRVEGAFVPSQRRTILVATKTEVLVKPGCPSCGNKSGCSRVAYSQGSSCAPSVSPAVGWRPSATLAIACAMAMSLSLFLLGCKLEPSSPSSAKGSSPFGPANSAPGKSAPVNAKGYMPVFDVQSQHGTRRVQVSRHDGRYFYVVDGKPSGDYADIGLDPPVFSADSRYLAYVVHRGSKLAVVLDGHEMPLFVDIASANEFLRSGNTAYLGRDQALNAEAVKHVGLVFSPDGQRLAYYAWTGEDEMAVVVNDKPGPVFHKIGMASISFSPDSKHLTYIGERAGIWYVVVDDRLSEGFDAIGWGSLHFAGDGPEVTFRAQRRGTWRAIHFQGR